ncbi:MAG: hypothetical protein EBX52_10215 [Proteobacteria bacterium]|nr:hypothetical protein [Pseudomonadota bacterium]
MKKVLLVLLVLLLVLLGGGYYATCHTALPLKAIAWAMNKAGIETAGIEGDLTSGFKLESLLRKGDLASYELKGLEFIYGTSSLVVGGKDAVIEQFNLKDIRISLKDLHQTRAKEETGAAGAAKEAPGAGSPAKSVPIHSVLVKRIQVDHGELTLGGRDRPYILKSFSAQDVRLDEAGVTTKTIKLAVPGMTVSIPGIKIGASQEMGLIAPADWTIKTDYHALLKKDLPLKLNVAMKPAPAKVFPFDVNLDLTGVDGHVKGQMDPSGALILEFNDLVANDWFKLNDQFGKLNAKMKVPDFKGSMNTPSEISGSIEIHGLPFELVRIEAQGMPGAVVMAVQNRNGIQAGVNIGTLLDSAKPAEGAPPALIAMVIRDEKGKLKSAEELLSQWLFKKPLKKLKPAERAELKLISDKFSVQVVS